VLRRQAVMIERGSREGIEEEWDRQEVRERYDRAMQSLEWQGRHEEPVVV